MPCSHTHTHLFNGRYASTGSLSFWILMHQEVTAVAVVQSRTLLHAKLPSRHHHQYINIQFSTGSRMKLWSWSGKNPPEWENIHSIMYLRRSTTIELRVTTFGTHDE